MNPYESPQCSVRYVSTDVSHAQPVRQFIAGGVACAIVIGLFLMLAREAAEPRAFQYRTDVILDFSPCWFIVAMVAWCVTGFIMSWMIWHWDYE